MEALDGNNGRGQAFAELAALQDPKLHHPFIVRLLGTASTQSHVSVVGTLALTCSRQRSTPGLILSPPPP